MGYKASYTPFPPSSKPLMVGWVPSKRVLSLMEEGRNTELPGYRLYKCQLKYPGKIGRLCGWLFSQLYAGKG